MIKTTKELQPWNYQTYCKWKWKPQHDTCMCFMSHGIDNKLNVSNFQDPFFMTLKEKNNFITLDH